MKKMLMLVTVLFSQVFFMSEGLQGTEIKPIERGKGDLCPAGNETD